ncbi:MAG: 5'-methylthioadenosine/S-adenosylhomocysteine nucleosidase [Bacteroides sp.]
MSITNKMSPVSHSEISERKDFRLMLLMAMPKEYSLVLPWLNSAHALSFFDTLAHLGKFASTECLLLLTGIGKVNAALRAYQAQLQFQADLVLNLGVCGALKDDLPIGTPVLSSSLTYHDVWCGAGNQHGQIQGLPAVFDVAQNILDSFHAVAPNLQQGLFCCGDYFMPSQLYIAQMLKYFPRAITVDMESTAIAQVAYLQGFKFASLRLVSDTPITHFDHAKQYSEFWEDPLPAFVSIKEIVEKFVSHYRADWQNE